MKTRTIKILVIKYGGLGDVLRTSYILLGLRDKFKNRVVIDWAMSQAALPLVRFNPFIREIFVDLHKASSVSSLINQHYDWLISLDDEDFSVNLTSRINYKKITGAHKDKGRIVYSNDSAKWFDMGLLSKFGKYRADQLKKENRLSHSKILEQILGIKISTPTYFNHPGINFDFLNLNKKIKGLKLGLNLCSGGRWPSKRLRKDETKKLVAYLVKHGTCFLLGGQEDFEYNKDIFLAMRNSRVILINPISVYEFADLIRYFDLLISSDSLALHLAIAQRVKNVSFYAPTSAVEIDTFGTGIKVISASKDYCSYKANADNSSLTADRIYQAASKFGLW